MRLFPAVAVFVSLTEIVESRRFAAGVCYRNKRITEPLFHLALCCIHSEQSPSETCRRKHKQLYCERCRDQTSIAGGALILQCLCSLKNHALCFMAPGRSSYECLKKFHEQISKKKIVQIVPTWSEKAKRTGNEFETTQRVEACDQSWETSASE